MAWTKGFNFRSTAVYVTDVAPDTYVVGAGGVGEAYPVTRNGVTFGYTTWAGGSIDNLGGGSQDPELSGRHYANPDNVHVFQVDLEAAATYDIRLANGNSGGGGQSQQHIVIKDNTSVVLTVAPASVTDHHFYDATGVDRTSESDWLTNNAKATATFSTSTLKLEIGGSGGYSLMAHLSLDRVVAAGVVGKSHIVSQAVNRASTY